MRGQIKAREVRVLGEEEKDGVSNRQGTMRRNKTKGEGGEGIRRGRKERLERTGGRREAGKQEVIEGRSAAG